jgi:hypothetical protein
MTGEVDLSGSDLTAAKSVSGVPSGLRTQRARTQGCAPVTWERRFGLVYVKVLEAGGTGGEGRAGRLYLAASVGSSVVGDKDPIPAVGTGTVQATRIAWLVGQ